MTPASVSAFRSKMQTSAETLFPGTLTIGEDEYPVAMTGGGSASEFDLGAEMETLSLVCHLSRERLETAPDDHLPVELNGQACRIVSVSNRHDPNGAAWRLILGPRNR